MPLFRPRDVDDRDYRAARGCKPSGRGPWAFEVEHRGGKDAIPVRPAMEYRDAVVEVQRQCFYRGLDARAIRLLPDGGAS